MQRLKEWLRPRTRARNALKSILYGIYDRYCDFRIGASTRGRSHSPFRRSGAMNTVSTRYWDLRRVFKHPAAAIHPTDRLVDVGCGQGRVLLWWVWQGVDNPIYGVELTEDVAEATRRQLWSQPVTILTGSIIDHARPDWTLYYLFNPFEKPVVQAFAERLKDIAAPGTRVIYQRALHADVFTSDPLTWHAEQLPTGRLNPLPVYVFTKR